MEPWRVLRELPFFHGRHGTAALPPAVRLLPELHAIRGLMPAALSGVSTVATVSMAGSVASLGLPTHGATADHVFPLAASST